MTAFRQVAVYVIVAMVMIGAGYWLYDNYQTQDWEDGAPLTTVRVFVDKVDASGDTIQTAQAELESDDRGAMSLFDGTHPMEIVDVGIPFVEPGSAYQLSCSSLT